MQKYKNIETVIGYHQSLIDKIKMSQDIAFDSPSVYPQTLTQDELKYHIVCVKDLQAKLEEEPIFKTDSFIEEYALFIGQEAELVRCTGQNSNDNDSWSCYDYCSIM